MQEIFQKIPLASLEYVKGLLYNQNILIKLKNNRKTKHGDFSVKKDFSCHLAKLKVMICYLIKVYAKNISASIIFINNRLSNTFYQTL